MQDQLFIFNIFVFNIFVSGAGLSGRRSAGSVSRGHRDGAGGLSRQGGGGLEQLPVSPLSHPTDGLLRPRVQPAAQLGPRAR